MTIQQEIGLKSPTLSAICCFGDKSQHGTVHKSEHSIRPEKELHCFKKIQVDHLPSSLEKVSIEVINL